MNDESKIQETEDDGIEVFSIEDQMRMEGVEVEEPESESQVEETAKGEKPEEEGAKEVPAPKKLEKKSRAQRRIERLAREKRELEARIRELTAKKDEPKEEPEKAGEEPNIDDYETFEEYEKALAEIEKKKNTEEPTETEPNPDTMTTITKEDVQDILRDGSEKYDDFKEKVMHKDVPITEEILELAIDSEIGDEILYYLANNIEEAKEIAALDTKHLAKEIGKIEAKLEEKKSTAPKPKLKTEAPEPITPVEGAAAKARDPEEMSVEEYGEWLASQSAYSPGGFL